MTVWLTISIYLNELVKKRNSNLFWEKYLVIGTLFEGKKCNEQTNLMNGHVLDPE